MNNIVEKLFFEIIKEARTCEISYDEIIYGNVYDHKVRMGFNFVFDNEVSSKLYNFYIRDYDNFISKLVEYVYCVIDLYNINMDENEIKKILIFLWSNITLKEMGNIDQFVSKYINFIKNDSLLGLSGSKLVDDIGFLNYSVSRQSYMQETPYCFSSFFNDDCGNIYYLPRISFEISNGKCYIYAIQNKEKNSSSDYACIVRGKLNYLNSGVKRYRNVSPSSLAALSLFLPFLRDNNINEIEAVYGLPIRMQNKQLVNDYKLEIESKTKDIVEIENLKKIMCNERLRICYNTTERFMNNFKRLAIHFKMIFSKADDMLDQNLVFALQNMNTNNKLFQQIVEHNIVFKKI